MLFFRNYATTHKQLKINKDSLQSYQTIIPITNHSEKRASQFAFCKASMTVEASIALPIFMFAIFFVLFFLEVIRIQMDVGSELSQTSKEMAVYGYLYGKAEDKELVGDSILGGIATNVFSNVYARHDLKQSLIEEGISEPYIKDGMDGISLLFSSYMQNEMIDLIATYKIQTPFNYFGIKDIPVMQRARVRAWTGYAGEHDSIKEEQMVYITENGTVYHTDISCSYLNPSTKAIQVDEIAGKRNQSGAKYYPCEICGDYAPSGGVVYITNYGNRYHTTASCSGLKRNIKVVPISEVGGRGLCSKCGGAHE